MLSLVISYYLKVFPLLTSRYILFDNVIPPQYVKQMFSPLLLDAIHPPISLKSLSVQTPSLINFLAAEENSFLYIRQSSDPLIKVSFLLAFSAGSDGLSLLRSLSLTHSENLPLTIPFFLVQDLLPSLIYSLSPPTHEAEYGSVIRTHSPFFQKIYAFPEKQFPSHSTFT